MKYADFLAQDFRIKVTGMKMQPADRSDQKTRVYVWLGGESILDNFKKRAGLVETDEQTAKRELEMKRRAARVAMSHFNVPDTFHYSRKAGCRCGCSPGFILSTHRGFDIFCTVSLAPKGASHAA